MSNGYTADSPEQWRVIPDFPDYSVSNTGRVVSHKSKQPRELKLGFSYNGYPRLQLSDGGKARYRKVHQLVLAAFVGPCPEGMEVCHADGDKTNNHLSNLSYGTRSQNMRDLVRHGGHNHASKTCCRNGHPFDEANTYEWRGARKCRTCRRTATARSATRRAFRAAGIEVAA